jgi:hypothetical protein
VSKSQKKGKKSSSYMLAKRPVPSGPGVDPGRPA